MTDLAHIGHIGQWIPLSTLVLIVVILGMIVALWRRRSEKEIAARLETAVAVIRAGQSRIESEMRDELSRSRRETAEEQSRVRSETGRTMKAFGETTAASLAQLSSVQHDRLDAFAKQLTLLAESNDKRLERMRETVEKQLRLLQDDNAKKLDQMRRTVDEKLQGTLERRLGESFKQVSDRLEQVHKGLGEMQTLASGVGDLKRVLSNVKIRGTWGEVQLEQLLEQILSPNQYSKNVATKPSGSERVEFCVNLPGRTEDGSENVWLPIDAKFPQEDFLRLVQAQEDGDLDGIESATKQLHLHIKSSAKNIRDKYINPPYTTDFAILFLPTEGLYAEIIRHPELTESLQLTFRVLVAGPTTLGALLNSLQMGFRTLAIEKRSSEVWETLGAIKTEFGKFGTIITKVQKKLHAASNEMDKAASKTRNIQQKLRKVEALPSSQAKRLLDDTTTLDLAHLENEELASNDDDGTEAAPVESSEV